MVFYESVHRVADCIAAMIAVFGPDRLAFIGREISKLHEQLQLATLERLHERLAGGDIMVKGEFVIVVAGAAAASDSSLDSGALLNELAGKLPDREVAKIVSKVTGERKNDLYRRLLEIAALRSQ